MMPVILLRLQRYLAGVVPLAGDLVPHPERGRLPLAFQESHAPYLGTIGTHTLTFLIAAVEDPAAAARSAAMVSKFLRTQDVVLVAEALTAAQRRGLIVAGIPFVVPDAHLWLPMLGMQFYERATPASSASTMKPATQALLLYWYYHGMDNSSTLASSAAVLGYTSMTMSRAFDELARFPHPRMRVERVGRERRCTTTLTRAELWQHHAVRARSPVVKRVLAVRTPALLDLPLAGLSAVASQSDMTAPSISVRAMDVATWRKRRKACEFVRSYERTDDMVLRVEIWGYPVCLHDPSSTIVDPISLALSIPTTEREDPRVAQALRLMGKTP